MTFNNRILVTGAGGLIGSVVCKYLSQNHVPYIALHRLGIYKENTWEEIDLDLAKKDSLKRVSSFSFLDIIHCAAEIPKSIKPDEAIRTSIINKIIDTNVFSFAKEIQARVIYASGTSVYGLNIKEEVNEGAAISKELNPYIKQKYLSEIRAMSMLENVILLRISAPYSHFQKSNTVLKIFIEQAIKGGNIFYHGTGSRQQDFTHVSDIANAVLKCVQNKNTSGIYNIASGRPISMKKLAELIVSKVPNSKSKILPSGIIDQQEDYKALFSIKKAEQELAWRPLISIEQGVSEWIKHLQK